jgi:hypothetical protein
MLFRAAEVIEDGLSEVVAVGERLAGDLGAPRVSGFQAEVGVVSTA